MHSCEAPASQVRPVLENERAEHTLVPPWCTTFAACAQRACACATFALKRVALLHVRDVRGAQLGFDFCPDLTQVACS